MDVKSYRPPGPVLRGLLIAVCAVQVLAIIAMVRERAAILASATVIEMDVAPVDPRSLFRGDYATLSYPAGRFKFDAASDRMAIIAAGQVFVTLTKDAAGEWRPVAVGVKRPVAKEGEVVLAARTDRIRASSQEIWLRYGIESYFVPEGEGKPIEDAARAKEVRVRVAVGKDGQAAIKALVAGGRVIEEPSL